MGVPNKFTGFFYKKNHPHFFGVNMLETTAAVVILPGIGDNGDRKISSRDSKDDTPINQGFQGIDLFFFNKHLIFGTGFQCLKQDSETVFLDDFIDFLLLSISSANLVTLGQHHSAVLREWTILNIPKHQKPTYDLDSHTAGTQNCLIGFVTHSWLLSKNTGVLLLMVQKSCVHQLRLVVYPAIYSTRFYTSQVVQDFFHQQYCITWICWSVKSLPGIVGFSF